MICNAASEQRIVGKLFSWGDRKDNLVFCKAANFRKLASLVSFAFLHFVSEPQLSYFSLRKIKVS